MALTVFRYYFHQMDNIQKNDLRLRMGISESALYRRLRETNHLTLNEAQIFCTCVYEFLGVQVAVEKLTDQIVPQP